jgi:hypothetical protein
VGLTVRQFHAGSKTIFLPFFTGGNNLSSATGKEADEGQYYEPSQYFNR